MKTQMSIEISKPTDFVNTQQSADVIKEEEMITENTELCENTV